MLTNGFIHILQHGSNPNLLHFPPPTDTPILSSQQQQQQQQQQQPLAAPESAKQPPVDEIDNTPTAPSEPKASETEDAPQDDTPSKPVQTNKGRCFKCRIKVRF
jgi:hypothetical protein